MLPGSHAPGKAGRVSRQGTLYTPNEINSITYFSSCSHKEQTQNHPYAKGGQWGNLPFMKGYWPGSGNTGGTAGPDDTRMVPCGLYGCCSRKHGPCRLPSHAAQPPMDSAVHRQATGRRDADDGSAWAGMAGVVLPNRVGRLCGNMELPLPRPCQPDRQPDHLCAWGTDRSPPGCAICDLGNGDQTDHAEFPERGAYH